MILNLTGAASVVDVGCGLGAWLSVFAEHGIADYLGVDGYVEPPLMIDPTRFEARDLEHGVGLDRTFDLAVCLEVGEHLREEAATKLVSDLVMLAPTVMFSAAVPGQGGIHHVNEQWPDYWAALFGAHSYVASDPIRPLIWDDDSVDWWYRQNILVYSRERLSSAIHDPLRRIVHPAMYADRARPLTPQQLLRRLPSAVARSVKQRLE